MSDTPDQPDGTGAEASSRSSTTSPLKLQSLRGAARSALHLIKKNEVNVYDIPIALITEQYLEYLNLMQELNLDVASEFLVMAATLIHIKSRMLLPRPGSGAPEPTDEERPARCARAAAARAPAVQGGGRAAARARDAAQRAVDPARRARRGDRRRATTSPSSRSISSACWRRSGGCSSAPASGRRCRCRPSRSRSRARIEQLLERLSETDACGFEDLFDDVAVARRPDRHVPGAARDDPAQAGARLPAGQPGPIRIYKRARPKDAPHPIHDPEDEYKAHHPASRGAGGADATADAVTATERDGEDEPHER